MAAAMQPRWAVRKTIVSSVWGLSIGQSGRVCHVQMPHYSSAFCKLQSIAKNI
jgi:hypothetical protein